MPNCIIDGKSVEFKPGENMIEVARRAGIEIPYFCYHPGLKVVAQCRMCAVEVEKMPKLQTACSTPPAEGMVIHTKSQKVKDAQKSVMEFLLINHPLDCPICDKSGECDLQDFSYKYGDSYSRYTEERRTYMDLDMGPVIKKNMNRCIHCTRCIRFGEEVAGIHEMVAVRRGNNTEITTIDGRPLETDYAGNYADICPTGSLTLKDFRFKKRAWMLKKTASVCEGCSKGCNLELQQDANVVYRSTPRENMEINRYWLCDEGRFNYQYVNSPNRVTEPTAGDWTKTVAAAREAIDGKKVMVLLGSDLTQEEATLAKDFIEKNHPGAAIAHFGTPGVHFVKDDAPADKLLKRKSKTANLYGLEKLGIKPFTEVVAGTQVVIVIRGGRAQLPDLKSLPAIGIGVFTKKQAPLFREILPGLSFAEKSGTVFNYEGREQRFNRAINSVGKSKALSEILMLMLHSKQKSDRSTQSVGVST